MVGPLDTTFPHVAAATADTCGCPSWIDTECAKLVSMHLPWADLEAERVYARIGPLWDIWYVVHGDNHAEASWQGRPIGAGVSVVSAATSDELVPAIRAYVAELPTHIEAERVKLRDADSGWHGYRQTHTQRLSALLALQDALAKTPV